MANLKSLLPVVTVPPLTNTVLGSSQQLTNSGSYYIDGDYSITLPPVGSFTKGDIITLTPKLGSVLPEAVGDQPTDIVTRLGVTDKIIFNKNIAIPFTHNGVAWEV